MRYRDKDYVRTWEGLLFNVTGYEHPVGHVYASLKYVAGKKWMHGYRAAVEFLSQHYPHYVDTYIRVPLGSVVEAYYPRRRWHSINEAACDRLLAKAGELGRHVA